MKNRSAIFLLLPLLSLLSWNCKQAESSNLIVLDAKKIQAEFQNPPNEARPRVWWHWMNGNITKDGIEKDLNWLKSIGVGGVHNFDANLFTPNVVENKLVFMTDEWKDAFLFSTKKIKELDFEMAIAGSPGWSLTGGPWVPKEDAMKKFVWTETQIKGGRTYNGKLETPADNLGYFQNTAVEEGVSGKFIGEEVNYYNDAFVIAYRLPDEEKALQDFKPKVTSSGGTFFIEHLTDGDLQETSYLTPKPVGENMWVQYEFDSPQTFKALTVVGAITSAIAVFEGNPDNRFLQTSNDGINFNEVRPISGSVAPQITVAFEPTQAKYWRMNWTSIPPRFNPFKLMAGLPMSFEPEGIDLAEFNLHNTERIDLYEEKAGFAPWKEDTPSYSNDTVAGISQDEIIDISDHLNEDGILKWEAPKGNWNVIRFGYSLTGRQNSPASPEATGLEVDKLDEDAVRRYINHYLDLYADATDGNMGGDGLSHMIIDSYEAGHMNWTHDFSAEFEKRRKYSIIKWLPVLTGRIVESSEKSESFLWDFRKTIGEMISDNHYDIIGEELEKRGMKRYTESHENKRIFLADGMDVKRNADIPMAAMWTPGSLAEDAGEEVRSKADIREAASVANIYGQNKVAAESMTSVGRPFQDFPERLKRTADMELASGLNRFVIHTSVHQPLDKGPGFSLGPFGQYFSRHETWSSQAKPWIDYLSRSSHVLQKGQNVADVLYYYGENNNITQLFNKTLPDVPKGYEFDFVNSTALIEAIEFKNGKLTAKSGNTYEVLYLDKSAENMTLPVLKKLQKLVAAGAKVGGTKPQQSPSLSDNSIEFKKIVDEIWQSENIIKGTVGEALNSLNISEDVIVTNTEHEVLYRHRSASNMDFYWLNNRNVALTTAEVSFRITGKTPKLWHPETGEVIDVSYKIENGRTTVSLAMESWDAFFVVFADDTSTNEFVLPEISKEQILEINAPWVVSFQTENGSSYDATFETLQCWTDRPEEHLNYFSGTAIYNTQFEISELNEASNYEIDLGRVNHLAEVILNGQSLGTLWKTPFTIDLNEGLKEGQNTLEIKVTNLWVNKLIGDAKLPQEERKTFTTMPFYKGEEPLMSSGLLGPITVLKTTTKQ